MRLKKGHKQLGVVVPEDAVPAVKDLAAALRDAARREAVQAALRAVLDEHAVPAGGTAAALRARLDELETRLKALESQLSGGFKVGELPAPPRLRPAARPGWRAPVPADPSDVAALAKPAAPPQPAAPPAAAGRAVDSSLKAPDGRATQKGPADKISADEAARAVAMKRGGASIGEICRALNRGKGSVLRVLRHAGIA